MVTAPGPSYFFAAHVRGWNYDRVSVTSISDCNFFAWYPTQARYGAQVFAGTDLDGDGHDEIVAGAGPDPGVASLVRVFQYGAAGITPWFSLTAFPSGWMYGAKVTALTY